MSDVIESVIAFTVIASCFLFVAFCIAWVTVLPTIGLLYWMGYLK
jgi:hypothetical protein